MGMHELTYSRIIPRGRNTDMKPTSSYDTVLGFEVLGTVSVLMDLCLCILGQFHILCSLFPCRDFFLQQFYSMSKSSGSKQSNMIQLHIVHFLQNMSTLILLQDECVCVCVPSRHKIMLHIQMFISALQILYVEIVRFSGIDVFLLIICPGWELFRNHLLGDEFLL